MRNAIWKSVRWIMFWKGAYVDVVATYLCVCMTPILRTKQAARHTSRANVTVICNNMEELIITLWSRKTQFCYTRCRRIHSHAHVDTTREREEGNGYIDLGRLAGKERKIIEWAREKGAGYTEEGYRGIEYCFCELIWNYSSRFRNVIIQVSCLRNAITQTE